MLKMPSALHAQARNLKLKPIRPNKPLLSAAAMAAYTPQTRLLNDQLRYTKVIGPAERAAMIKNPDQRLLDLMALASGREDTRVVLGDRSWTLKRIKAWADQVDASDRGDLHPLCGLAEDELQVESLKRLLDFNAELQVRETHYLPVLAFDAETEGGDPVAVANVRLTITNESHYQSKLNKLMGLEHKVSVEVDLRMVYEVIDWWGSMHGLDLGLAVGELVRQVYVGLCSRLPKGARVALRLKTDLLAFSAQCYVEMVSKALEGAIKTVQTQGFNVVAEELFVAPLEPSSVPTRA